MLWFIVGFVVGAGIAGGVARWAVRRSLRRVRAAERRARSAERMAEIGALTSGLAHEIKNPLSTIGLNAQLLAEGIDDLEVDADARARLSRRVGTLRREVERLRGILQDFLDFAGAIRVDPLPSDLNAVVQELVDFFLPQAEKQGVRLRADLSGASGEAHGGSLIAPLDVQHVKQAVLNLMLNAVQAMAAEPGERSPRELILKTGRGEEPDGRSVVMLHVIDTGPGIAPEKLGRIFDPYFTTKPGGTGLGLPTARRLVEAHGGRIDVHTEVGKGTDFVLVFPAEAAALQAAAAK